MIRLSRLGCGAVAAGGAWVTLLHPAVAAADDYAGQSYSDASQAIGSAGQKSVIAASVGDGAQGDCVVTRSQMAPWLKGDNFSPVTDTVLLYLNCNAKLAKAGKAGNSLASPEGRAEKADEDAQAAQQEQEAAAQAAAQQNQSSELIAPGGD